MTAMIKPHDAATGGPGGCVLGTLGTFNNVMVPHWPIFLAGGTRYWIAVQHFGVLRNVYLTKTELADYGAGSIIYSLMESSDGGQTWDQDFTGETYKAEIKLCPQSLGIGN